ncbi:MAG: D-alanyl-D-alanine carboxypeptidase/D-alanyl-D-alanine-endopeptidase, partial [Candidatus Sumerlaeota bacterium]|nr:D-alanyl-D-alanine carboxypeptidase/D-alanyl-D-alanine-endopeptidase [Candidatus Sumerlaeota bacterium]
AIRNETTTSSKSGSIDVSREHNSDTLVVRGHMPPGIESDPEVVTVADPSKYGGSAVLAALDRQGIEVEKGLLVTSGAPKSSGNPADLIAEQVSLPLEKIIQEVNQSSNNHMAEMLYLTAGHEATKGPGSYDVSRNVEKRFWAKLGLTDAARLHEADGCGLSRLNLFTPRSFCELLRRMQSHPAREAFVNSLAINGKSGTLRSRLWKSDYAQHVLGKTGYISNVSCLSGYLIDQTKRTLVFSILVNNFTCSTSSIKAAQDQMCEWLIDLPQLSSGSPGGSKTAGAKTASPKTSGGSKTTSSKTSSAKKK